MEFIVQKKITRVKIIFLLSTHCYLNNEHYERERKKIAIVNINCMKIITTLNNDDEDDIEKNSYTTYFTRKTTESIYKH